MSNPSSPLIFLIKFFAQIFFNSSFCFLADEMDDNADDDGAADANIVNSLR